MPRRKPAPHWYKISLGECPVCGRPKTYRERQYTPRPEHATERYEQLSDSECYDWCLEA